MARIVINNNSSIFVNRSGDFIFGDITFTGNSNLLTVPSGNSNIGEPSYPFGTAYLNDLFISGVNIADFVANISGQYVDVAGDTMTGDLVMSGASIVPYDSGTNSIGNLAFPFDHLAFTSGNINSLVSDSIITTNLLADSSDTINSSGNFIPIESGTDDLGSTSNYFGTLYVDNIVSPGGEGAFVNVTGDTMTGDLTMSGADVLTDTSGTNDVGASAVPFANGYFDNITVNGTALVSPRRVQLVKTTVQNLNTTTATTLTWDTQDFLDADFSHTIGASSITINTAGNYKVSFNINGSNASGSRKTPRISMFIDGVETTATRSYGYARNSNDGETSVNLPPYEVSLASGEVITFRSIRAGTGGVLNSIANEAWIRIERYI